MEHVSPRRLQHERAGIRAMISIYCRAKHRPGRNDLCRECQEMLAYAEKRLACCPFAADKPTCGKCTVHCYKPALRAQVRRIMRFSGPRMLWRHPLMAIRHLLDSRRPAPPLTHPAALSPPAADNSRRTGP